MKTWLCNGCVFFLCFQVSWCPYSLRKKIKKFFLKKYHIFEIILHINCRAYEQNVRDIKNAQAKA